MEKCGFCENLKKKNFFWGGGGLGQGGGGRQVAGVGLDGNREVKLV